MVTNQNHNGNLRNQRDIEILKKPNVVEWLRVLEKEFALKHSKKSTRKSYKGWIIDFILWKYRTHCMEVSEGGYPWLFDLSG